MYRAKQGQQRVSQALAVQAPVGGLNDLDPLSAMPDSFMIDCMNFYPDTGVLAVRPGYQEWATKIGSLSQFDPGQAVLHIMSYNAIDGSFKTFCCTYNLIYNISTSGANPPAAFDHNTGTGAVWVDTNFATAGGQYLVAVTGKRSMFYDGTAWHLMMSVVTPAAPGEISGVDPSTFSYVITHKGRLWFIEKNSMVAWYLPIDALGGVAEPFFVGGLFKKGGYLATLATWSADTGEGLDDRLVFITSTGEIASYSGSDPSDASDWSLDSLYFIAPPLSTKAAVSYGGDVLFLSRRGLVPLSSLMSSSMTETLYSNVLTRRISRTLQKLTRMGGQPVPIEISVHSDAAWVVISIVDKLTNLPIQLVMNFLTGAWGKFDYPVTSIRTVDRNIFMATTKGRVLVITPEAYVDNVLLDGTGGVPIKAYAMGAFTYLGDPTTNKHAKLMRPVFQTEVKPSFRMRAQPDFRVDRFTAEPPPSLSIGNANWDEDSWDEANWASYENIYRPWVSANVLGYSFAWQLRVNTSSAFGLAAVEWVWESGGLV